MSWLRLWIYVTSKSDLKLFQVEILTVQLKDNLLLIFLKHKSHLCMFIQGSVCVSVYSRIPILGGNKLI